MEKQCLECGEKVMGRADKKFCSDYCRNSFNNKIDKGDKNLVRNINNRLKKNYKILSELNPNEKGKTHRDKLISKNFDFNYFTSIYTNRILFVCQCPAQTCHLSENAPGPLE